MQTEGREHSTKDRQRENLENFCPFQRKDVTKDVGLYNTPDPTPVWMRRAVQGRSYYLLLPET